MEYGSAEYIMTAFFDFLLPGECLVCGRELLVNEKHICAGCLDDMPMTYFWKNPGNGMDVKFNSRVAGSTVCRDMHLPYSYAAALYFYKSAGGYSRLSQALKYDGDIASGKFFAGMLGRRMNEAGQFSDVTAVVPVPLHWTRRWRRGYNQAEVIAREVAREMGCPLETGMLSRIRRTETQTRLSTEAKAENVKGAFSADAAVLARILGSADGGMVHLLLVDDVFTTGSTLCACNDAIREALAGSSFPQSSVRISVATLGYVGDI